MPRIKRWILLNNKKLRHLAMLKYFVLILVLFASTLPLGNSKTVQAESCPELKIVFARGSGGERWKDDNYLEFKRALTEKLPVLGLTYEFLDLDYPAVGVGLDNLGVTLGAFFGAGDAYEFGDSVDAGVLALKNEVNDKCPDTKYVLGGYSQGAMVISKALPSLKSNKIIYAATFGDPKIYLPEGAGILPAACKGENLSSYRAYVPDCQAYKGLLGSYEPYEPEGFTGKLGTWCNKSDVFCSSHYIINDHLSYISDNLYEDASRMIVHKVTAAFGLKNEYTSPHDTVILIDSTSSMETMIESFKNEARRLASETFKSGGRVALYDYRDLDDPYEPVARCDFETCTAENIDAFLNEIVTGDGGDGPESMLSAAMKAMHELKWRRGATKSMVVLTDAPFLSPDRDATTVEDVVALSKRIDPVNIYLVTTEYVVVQYPEVVDFAEATGGSVFTNMGELDLMTNYIMERFDSLPRVEEESAERVLPEIDVELIDGGSSEITVRFNGDSEQAVVILNDAVLGVAETGEVKIKDLNRNVDNHLMLVPLKDGVRGEGVEIVIKKREAETRNDDFEVKEDSIDDEKVGEDKDAETISKGDFNPKEVKTEIKNKKTEVETKSKKKKIITEIDGETRNETEIKEKENRNETEIKIAPFIPKAPDTGVINQSLNASGRRIHICKR